MGGDEGEKRVLRQSNGVGRVKSHTAQHIQQEVEDLKESYGLQLKAGAVPATKRVEFHS